MAHYLEIGEEQVEVPAEVRDPDLGDTDLEDWIVDQLLDRELIDFDPRELTVDEVAAAVQDVDDRQVIGLLRDAETRATAVEAIRARGDELKS